MESEGELLPCPFCGGDAQFITLGSTVGLPQYQVECAKDCGAGHPANSAVDAVAEWNARVDLSTSVPDETAKAVATRIADDLFRNGAGEEADHLRMVQDLEQPSRYLGGWSKKAVIDRIAAALAAKGE